MVCNSITISIPYTCHSGTTVVARSSTSMPCPKIGLVEHMRRQTHHLLTRPRGIPIPIAGSRELLPAFRAEETRAYCTKQAAKAGCPKAAFISSGVARKVVPMGPLLPDAINCDSPFASDSAVRWVRGNQRGISGQCRRKHKLDRAIQSRWRHCESGLLGDRYRRRYRRLLYDSNFYVNSSQRILGIRRKHDRIPPSKTWNITAPCGRS